MSFSSPKKKQSKSTKVIHIICFARWKKCPSPNIHSRKDAKYLILFIMEHSFGGLITGDCVDAICTQKSQMEDERDWDLFVDEFGLLEGTQDRILRPGKCIIICSVQKGHKVGKFLLSDKILVCVGLESAVLFVQGPCHYLVHHWWLRHSSRDGAFVQLCASKVEDWLDSDNGLTKRTITQRTCALAHLDTCKLETRKLVTCRVLCLC